jgi:hypothetical protein
VDEFFGPGESEAMFGGKFFGADCHKHHVFTFFEHQARETDRITNVFDGGHGARF